MLSVGHNKKGDTAKESSGQSVMWMAGWTATAAATVMQNTKGCATIQELNNIEGIRWLVRWIKGAEKIGKHSGKDCTADEDQD